MKVVELSIPPNEQLVKMLEQLLVMARSGDLQGGAFAGGCGDRCSVICWTKGDIPNALLLGAMRRLEIEYHDEEFKKG